MKMNCTAIMLLLGISIVGCSDNESDAQRESTSEKEPVLKQMTVRGVLNHFPSDVKSTQAWHGHNFMVGDTPVIATEKVPEEALLSFVGKDVVVIGFWHPGEQWNPTEEEMNMPMPRPLDPSPIMLDPQNAKPNEVVRGDGIKASSISPVEK